MATVEGHCDPRFAALRATLAEQIASGNELGASIVLNIDGENVVDIWGGHADEARTQPWHRDTITNVWSSTKTVAALAILIQVSRGKLDVDAPVADYWPEFAQNGKQGVKVKHLLSHTSGVSGWDQPVTGDDIFDLPTAVARLEKQAPWWEPGTASGYHAINYGHLLGELIRRTAGKSMKRFVADEIAGPLRADFQIGADEKDWPRIAPVVPPPPAPFDLTQMDPDSPAVKTFTGPPLDATQALRPEWRRADMAGVNGHGNARSLAQILSTVTRGGGQLLSAETVDQIFDVQADGTDLVIGIPLRFGTGYGLTGGGTATSVPWLPQGKICFWGGWGGSIGLMDLDRKVTFTYVMNKMGAGILGSDRTEAYVRAAYKALGVEGY
jgi:CubicO group peptidase (beta-lactamase class C family)